MRIGEYPKPLNKIQRLISYLWQEITGKPSKELIFRTRDGYTNDSIWALAKRIQLAEDKSLWERIKRRVKIFWYQHELDVWWKKIKYDDRYFAIRIPRIHFYNKRQIIRIPKIKIRKKKK